MGILGLETTSFLSDRIFKIIDSNNDSFVRKLILFFLKYLKYYELDGS
jgi:hypothetical protein